MNINVSLVLCVTTHEWQAEGSRIMEVSDVYIFNCADFLNGSTIKHQTEFQTTLKFMLCHKII